MTHDYKRNGTTTLFAALNVLDGTVVSIANRRTTLAEVTDVLQMKCRRRVKVKP
jgi:hypothetical protein